MPFFAVFFHCGERSEFANVPSVFYCGTYEPIVKECKKRIFSPKRREQDSRQSGGFAISFVVIRLLNTFENDFAIVHPFG